MVLLCCSNYWSLGWVVGYLVVFVCTVRFGLRFGCIWHCLMPKSPSEPCERRDLALDWWIPSLSTPQMKVFAPCGTGYIL